MMKFMTAAVLTAGTTFGGHQAYAATLGLVAEEPVLITDIASVDNLEIGLDGELSTYTAFVDTAGQYG